MLFRSGFATDGNHKGASQQASQQGNAEQIVAGQVADRAVEPDTCHQWVEIADMVHQQECTAVRSNVFGA